MARSPIDIAALDLRVQERILAVGSLKDFRVVLWRHEADASGCNWDGRIERLNGAALEGPRCDLVILVCASCSISFSSPDESDRGRATRLWARLTVR